MPSVVFAAIWPYLIGVMSGTAIWAVSYAITFAAYYAYGTYQARQARNAARDSFNASLRDRLVMTSTTDNPRARVYGRARNVDGLLFKATHGDLKQFYTFVVAVAGHEIDGFESYYFNDLKLTTTVDGYVTNTEYTVRTKKSASELGTSGMTLAHTPIPGSVGAVYSTPDTNVTVPVTVVGSVVTYTPPAGGEPVTVFYQWEEIRAFARVRGFAGSASQDLSAELIALGIADVTSTDKFRGIACLLVTLEFNTDVFPQGVPSMSAVIRGAKVFDPRTGLTVWTENPALIARDWALYPFGGGATTGDLYDDFSAEANACDVSHVFQNSLYGPTARPMYTCGIVAPTGGDPTQVMNEIVTSMAGKSAWVGGKLRVKAGAYRAPVATITDDWLSDNEAIEIQAGVARNDLVNSYRPSISDARKDYVIAPTQAVIASAYIAADGVELPREVSFVGITDSDHAQHVAGVLLRDARQALTVKLACNMRAYPLEVFDVVALTFDRFGWIAKPFEILATEFSLTKGVLLTMKETDASIFDPDAAFTSDDPAPNTSLPSPWRIDAPFNVQATSIASALGDSIVTKTRVTWELVEDAAVFQSGNVEVQYVRVDLMPLDDTQDWPSQTEKATAFETDILGLEANRLYIIRARTINSLGVRSPWSLQIAHRVDALTDFIADWTDIPGRPIFYRAISRGLDDTSAPLAAGLYDENGALISGAARSYIVNAFDRATGLPVALPGGVNVFDVYGTPSAAGAMATALNALGTDRIVCVRTYDEPFANRLNSGLYEAMLRCGASPAIFGKPTFQQRSAYMLVAIAGCGAGNGFEAYTDYSVPTRVFCDVTFMLKSGIFMVTGTGNTPGSIRDYGYVGSLDATTDITLVARGACVVAGNFAQKLGSTTVWNSDVYSVESFRNGAFASAIANDSVTRIMFGLNSDPTLDLDFLSLDFAIYLAQGVVHIYEGGVQVVASAATYVAGDSFAVIYDGVRVYYLKNGVILYQRNAAQDLRLFFDSSFFDPNGALRGIRFGPLSAVNQIGTNQVVPNAVSDIIVSQHGAGSVASTTHPAVTTAIPEQIVYPNAADVPVVLNIDASLVGISATGGTLDPEINVWIEITSGLGTTSYALGSIAPFATDNGGWFSPQVVANAITYELPVGYTATVKLKVVAQPSAGHSSSGNWLSSLMRIMVFKR